MCMNVAGMVCCDLGTGSDPFGSLVAFIWGRKALIHGVKGDQLRMADIPCLY